MTKSHENYEYFVTWIDDKSRKVFVDGIKLKSEVVDRLKTFVERAEVETNHRVVSLRSDGGGEYIAGALQQYLRDKGIKHEMTTPDTPQHNGVAERMNRTLLDKVRAMLTDATLPETYWYDAIRYAAHIHNVTPTQALDGMTPEEAWSGNKPDVSDI
jgi:transposase InsO family protein